MPVYDAKVPTETVRALLNEKAAAHLLGDDLIVEFLQGCSHPAVGRNHLAEAFMESDYDRLIFIDSDVTWETGYLLKIAHYPVDFVGGCYRYKGIEEEKYPIDWIQDRKELWSNEYGLIEVAALPGGFLSLSRKVFETIKETFPERVYDHFGNSHYCYFEMPYRAGCLLGEDGAFSLLWRSAGGKIFLDPMITLTHWDFKPMPYEGNIGNWLKKRMETSNASEKIGI